MIHFLQFDNYITEAYETRGLEDELRNKANMYKDKGYTYHILRLVYTRGSEEFYEKKKSGSVRNFAMKRVNDFLNKGRYWSVNDTDLADEVRKKVKKLNKKKKKK